MCMSVCMVCMFACGMSVSRRCQRRLVKSEHQTRAHEFSQAARASTRAPEPRTWKKLGMPETPQHEVGPPRIPVPTRIPIVNTELSSLYIESDGRKLRVHPSMIARMQHATPLKTFRGTCNGCTGLFCCDGWPRLKANDIIVLKVVDFEGGSAYGWFCRFEAEPLRLVRVPPATAASLFVRLHDDQRLRRCSLYERMTDVLLFDDEFAFDQLLVRRLKRMNEVANPSRKRKRSKGEGLPVARVALEHPEQLATPSAPASPRRNMQDSCSLCLEEVEITPSSCCGASGGACRKCSEKLRGLCTLCDRRVLTSSYECETCKRAHSFEHSGYPCCSCGVASMCRDCHSAMGVCWECIGKE